MSDSPTSAQPSRTFGWSQRSLTRARDPKKDGKEWGGTLPTVCSLGELLSKKLPPRVPIIAPWFHAGESCLIWGGSGTGKSMITLTMALAAAGGGSVLGWTFPNPCKVVYVDGEQSEHDLQTRLRGLAATIDGHDMPRAETNLSLIARTAQEHDSGKFIDIAKPDQAVLFLDEIKARGTQLVIFDNLSTLSDTIVEENSAAAFKPMQSILARLKKLNCAVVLVHHAGKDPTKGFRGSSAIATTFERILAITHNPSAADTVLDVTVALEKFRDRVPAGFQICFPLKYAEEDGATPRWEVGQIQELEEGWRMFCHGNHTSVDEFVRAYNQRFGGSRTAGNFGRQFAKDWITKLGKTPDEIEAGKAKMKALRECDKDGGEEEAAPVEGSRDF